MPKQKQNIDYLLLLLEKEGVLKKDEDKTFFKDLLQQSNHVDRLFELYSKHLN